jgi:hypothetical protein
MPKGKVKQYGPNEFQFFYTVDGPIETEADFEEVKAEVIRWVSLLEKGELEESSVMAKPCSKEPSSG